MSWGLAISGLLYPTVGAALFLAWGFAAKWEERGQKKKALAMRAFVILVACYPLVWSLRLIYLDLGWEALRTASILAGGAILLYLGAFRLRDFLHRHSVRRSTQGTFH